MLLTTISMVTLTCVHISVQLDILLDVYFLLALLIGILVNDKLQGNSMYTVCVHAYMYIYIHVYNVLINYPSIV